MGMGFLKQVSIFLILGQTILHFAPGDKYEKYIKMLLGFMLIAQFAAPLIAFTGKNKLSEYESNKEMFTQKMEESLREVDEKWFLYNEQIEQQIEKELENAQQMLWEQERSKEGQDMEGMPGEDGENRQDESEGTEEETAEEQENRIGIDAVKIEVTANE